MGLSTLIFAYVGPDTLLPVASGLAGLAGVVLMFGRRIWATAAAVARAVRGSTRG